MQISINRKPTPTVLCVSIVAILIAAFLMVPGTPAKAEAEAEAVSYLFVLDSDRVRIKPGKGDVGRIVVKTPTTTRFTDRPVREAEQIATRLMLREFGWDRESGRLRVKPNAAVSIDGRSQIVEIRRAAKLPGRLVLWVRGVNGPLQEAAGAGNVFIDNAPGGYNTRTLLLPFPQFDTYLYALAGPSNSVEITLVTGSSIDSGGESPGGTTVQSITIEPDQPYGDLTWFTVGTEATAYFFSFLVQSSLEGLSIGITGNVNLLDGNNIPINASVNVPSYWCLADQTC